MNNDIVGSIPARLDGRLAEFEPPPEHLYPKYAEYMRLKSAVDKAAAELDAAKYEMERLKSKYSDTRNVYEDWKYEMERLLSLSYHPERDRRIAYAEKAVAGGHHEMMWLYGQQMSQETKVSDALEASFKARAELDEYIISLCK
jgi:hypothetical protein